MGINKELSLRTISEIFVVSKIIDKLELKFKLSYRLGRLIKRVTSAYEEFDKKKNKLIIDKYGEKQESGDYRITDPKKLNDFSEEVSEQLKDTETIQIPELEWGMFVDEKTNKWKVSIFAALSDFIIKYDFKMIKITISNDEWQEVLAGVMAVSEKEFETEMAMKLGMVHSAVADVVRDFQDWNQGVIKNEYGSKQADGSFKVDTSKTKAYTKALEAQKEKAIELELPELTFAMFEELELPPVFAGSLEFIATDEEEDKKKKDK